MHGLDAVGQHIMHALVCDVTSWHDWKVAT